MTAERAPRWPVALGAAVGASLTAVGITTLLQAADDTNPSATVKWLVGLALVHDLVLVPIVLLVGTALRRLVPAAARAWSAGALLISGTVALVAWPLVRGYGRSPGNPSILPRDYGAGLAIVLILVWVTAAALALLSRYRQHLEGPST